MRILTPDARPPAGRCTAPRPWAVPRTDAAAARAFVARRYAEMHDASIACAYPELVVVEDAEGRCRATAGFRRPTEAFFLEQYLDGSAQSVLASSYGAAVERGTIVEIGNLAGDGSGATFALLQGLLHHLVTEGYEHVLLTCTPRLRRWFADLPHVRLAAADPARVSDAASWGRYYAHLPEVVSGRLRDYDHRFATLGARPGLAFRTIPADEAPVPTPSW